MANVVLTLAARNALSDALAAVVDSGPGAGLLRLYTAADQHVADIPLLKPAFYLAINALIVLRGPVQANAADSGKVAKFSLTNSLGLVVLQGTVDESGAPLNMDNVYVVVGKTVTLDALTYLTP